MILPDNFLNKILFSDGCWEWIGAKSNGYGDIRGHSEYRAHRLSWVLFNGPIKPGLVVCHKCDNPSCVNPSHLFLGTYSDNTKDAMAKGRQVIPENIGEDNGRRVLTEEQVRAIREEYSKGSRRYKYGQGEFTKALARRFGVSGRHIRAIAARRYWAHLD